MKAGNIDYEALRKKFPPKNPARVKNKAAIKAIAREYERKKAELGLRAPVMRRGIAFYAFVIIGLALLGSLVLSAVGKGGRRHLDRQQMNARKAMTSLTLALGRFKFHCGEYPSTEDGLAALAYDRQPALSMIRRKYKAHDGFRGWDGPYVRAVNLDPWGHPYVYETRQEGGNPVLYSLGPDGRMGTTDDILPEQTLFDEPFRDTTWTNHWLPCELRGYVVAPDEETRKKLQEEIKKY